MPGATSGTRDAVAEVFDKLSAETTDETSDVSADVGGDLQDAGSGSSESPEQSFEAAKGSKSADSKGRDPKGRFAKKEAEGEELAPKGKLAAVPDLKAVAKEKEVAAEEGAEGFEGEGEEVESGTEPEVEDPAIGRAPPSWRAHVREEWKKLPKSAREEIHRLDKEARISATRASKEGEYANRVRDTVGPYEGMFRAAGVETLQGVGNLLQRYNVLQNGPVQHKIAVIGDLIRNFVGVDEGSLTALAQVLHGGGQGGAPAPSGLTPQDVQGMIDKGMQQRQQEADTKHAQTTVTAFKASKPEFLNDVKGKMSAILEVMSREKQGARLTLEDLKEAYDQACQLDKHVKSVLDQRRQVKEAKEARAKNGSSTEKAVRAAAASGRSDSSGGSSHQKVKAATTHEEVSRQFDLADAKARGKKS